MNSDASVTARLIALLGAAEHNLLLADNVAVDTVIDRRELRRGIAVARAEVQNLIERFSQSRAETRVQ